MLTRVFARPLNFCNLFKSFLPRIALYVLLLLMGPVAAHAQLPYTSGGPNSAFAQLDFGQIDVDDQIWDADTNNSNGDVVDFSAVSPLDLQAPRKAVQEFKHARSLMKEQNSKDAVRFLERAVAIYPKFVSAYNALGLAYLDQHDPRARMEFETAAKLDDQFPGSYENLGVLDLSVDDFAGADSNLQKAASLRPNDPRTLTALAFAENGDRKYAECLRTVRRVHSFDHRGMANVHYIGAAAALSLRDLDSARRELGLLLNEDPTNPLSPVARKKLTAIASPSDQETQAATVVPQREQQLVAVENWHLETFPNNQHLAEQLTEISDAPDLDSCDRCKPQSQPLLLAAEVAPAPLFEPHPAAAANLFTIRQSVDETALFFSVSHRGHLVNDLSPSDIHILDNNKPPAKILEFKPQSKLPLRLGLLIDTSDSVQRRFSFEKHAAEEFIQRVLNPESDFAFVAGFSDQIAVSQDFTSDPEVLSRGIENLDNNGETALFDAVYFACWKLAAYPDEGRVAKVLVVLTDGEDNSSHRSLKQALEIAEAAGVTVYSVSTAEATHSVSQFPGKTDADKILEELAARSGGEAIFPGSLNALDRYLAKLPEVIRSRYLIAYRPANFAPNGKYRSIRVVAEKDGRRLHVTTRKGYYARLTAGN